MSKEVEGIEEEAGDEYGEMTGTMRAILAAVQRLAEENARLARRVAEVGGRRPAKEQARPELLEPEDVPDAVYARSVHEAAVPDTATGGDEASDEPEDPDGGDTTTPVFPEVSW